jgi:hypothetical protein
MAQYNIQLCRGYESIIDSYENDLLLRIDLSTKAISLDTVLDLLNLFAVDRIRNKNWMVS